jgi:thymidylate synthase (FAD)
MKVDVLDHGYVEFIEAWGTGRDGHGSEVDMEPRDYEVGIIEAARQSTQGSFRGWEEDWKLLTFLYNNTPPHAGPFEFAGMTIEVQAPIFVFREWHRHRTQSYNEMSARYTPLPDLYYYPTVERILRDGGKNKQAQGIVPLERGDAEGAIHAIAEAYADAERIYQHLLKKGVPKEVARVVMPVGHYSRMRATGNLRNWLAFLTLRCDPNAQWEIQQYANIVASIIAKNFPRTYSQWVKK